MARPQESLIDVRKDARRERLLDMELRLRPYRIGCFAILAVVLAVNSWEIGWWWILPLALGLAGFAVADSFVKSSPRPALWIAAAWGVLPLLLAGAVALTGGAGSAVLMWFAIPAVTLGARFEPRGMVLGTAYVLVVLGLTTYGLDPATAADHQQEVMATAALVLCIVLLSGALVESDRAHRRRSTLDPLTGLFNRSALDQRLSEIEGQPTRQDDETGYALLLCDLDHFKRINDQLGHSVGDAVLQDVAYTMRAVLRAGDSIYRVGGEEILVVLPGAGRESARQIAERLRIAVHERRPVGVAVTVSVGVAVSQAGVVETGDLVRDADAALYAAKKRGRNRVVVDGDGRAVSAAEVDARLEPGGEGRDQLDGRLDVAEIDELDGRVHVAKRD
jgi:diguanylate cyclase (GGDEF)-like protein